MDVTREPTKYELWLLTHELSVDAEWPCAHCLARSHSSGDESVDYIKSVRKNSCSTKEGGFEVRGEILLSTMSEYLASSMSLSDDMSHRQFGS